MKEVLTVRVENELREALEREAEIQGRSRSNLIQLVLKQYLESKKESK